MVGSLYLSTRSIIFHSGSIGGIPGKVASFELKVQRAGDLSCLVAVTDELWREYPLPFLQQVWFRRAVREEGVPDIASWMVALVVALQWQAGDPVGPGRVLSGNKDSYTLLVPWERREVLDKAIMFAQRLLVLWLRRPAPSGEDCARALVELETWMFSCRPGRLHHGVSRLVIAARARNIPVELPSHDVVFLGSGSGRRQIPDAQAAYTSTMLPPFAFRLSLRTAGFPTAAFLLCENTERAAALAKEHGYPMHLSHAGIQVTDWTVPPVTNEASLLARAEELQKARKGEMVLQSVAAGSVHHFVCVDGRVLVATRMVASRGPQQAQSVFWAEVTESVHPTTRQLIERCARVLREDVVLIALHVKDITQPIDTYSGNPCVISDCLPLRSFPSYLFRLTGIDLAWAIVAQLLEGRPYRPPIAAITGSFGAATTSQMLASIWMAAGKTPGLASPGALWVGATQISQEKLDPEASVKALFAQPDVESVVFEVPEAGLGDNGNPCDHYDVAAFLNFQPGVAAKRGREVVTRLLLLRGAPLEVATTAVVLNAEDEHCMALVPRIICRRHILVAPTNPEVAPMKAHLAGGGEALLLEQREGKTWIMLAHGRSRSPVMAVAEIPAAGGGSLQSVVTQALFASALGVAHDLPLETIRRGLIAFAPDFH
jgi:hypothetical protein